ncbi:MAG: winged helix-turn-helix transcriptional regulator [candidate division WOR-3 bacterium]|nr:winged helix-turn-helix transcriptional regulator [candidate division WOR-3 bacterium]
MNNRVTQIADIIKSRGSARTAELSEALGISRQMVHRYLKELIKSGIIMKRGSTRSAVYMPAGNGSEEELPSLKKIYEKPNPRDVYTEFSLKLRFSKYLNKNAGIILRRIFLEMIDNAVRYSGTDMIEIEGRIDDYNISVSFTDSGSGIFENIMKNNSSIESEFKSILHIIDRYENCSGDESCGGLVKCIQPSRYCEIKSHKQTLIIDRGNNEHYVKEHEFFRGTSVRFLIALNHH